MQETDEEWTEQPSEDSLFLVQPGRTPATTTTNSSGQHSWRGHAQDVSLPRARRVHNNNPSPSEPNPPPVQSAPVEHRRHRQDPNPSPHNKNNNNNNNNIKSNSNEFRRRRQAEERQRTPSPATHHSSNGNGLSPRDRFKDAKEKFQLLEKERHEEQEQHLKTDRRRQNVEPPISPAVVRSPNSRKHKAGGWSRSRDSEDDLEDRHISQPQPPRNSERGYFPQGQEFGEEFNADDVEEEGFDTQPAPERVRGRNSNRIPRRNSQGRKPHEEEVEERSPTRRMRIPSAHHRGSSSHTRNPSSHQYEPESHRQTPRRHHSPERRVKNSATPPVRYHSPSHNPNPRPTPRTHEDPALEEHVRYRKNMNHTQPYVEDTPLHRYRSPVRQPQPAPRQHRVPPSTTPERDASPTRQYPKRRSMFDALEEERRRNSHELAREFKRRSYQDCDQGRNAYHGYQELPDRERFPGLDRESARKQSHHRGAPAGGNTTPGSGSAGYRHSYAEGPMHHEVVHRTSSSVSSGRVGIAAVHPY